MSESSPRNYISAQELIARIRKYHPDDDMSLVQRAYEYAERAHADQVRHGDHGFHNADGTGVFCIPAHELDVGLQNIELHTVEHA